MSATIVQKARFAASPEELSELYLNARLHSAATGEKASISAKAGARFSAWGGYIQGRNLQVIPGRLVVQTWRASDWPEEAPDSVLVLTFERDGAGGVVALSHCGVPDEQKAALSQGWKDFYWKPWRAFLKARRAA